MSHYTETLFFAGNNPTESTATGLLNLARLLYVRDVRPGDLQTYKVEPGTLAEVCMSGRIALLDQPYNELKSSLLKSLAMGAPYAWVEIAGIAKEAVEGEEPVSEFRRTMVNLDRVHCVLPFGPTFTLIEFDTGETLYVGASYGDVRATIVAALRG